ncbi:MAG: prepilin-type N-terminal cleavage/methylation domain-containing protein [Planctomycetota bacterium]
MPRRLGYRNDRNRRGLSLLELLVVVTLIGVLSSVVLIRYGRDIFGDAGAKSETQILSQGIRHAQRAAIRTGDRHGLIVQGTASDATGWSIVRELSDGSRTLIDGPHLLTEEVTVSASTNEMWFDFEGSGSSFFSARLSGPNRVFEVKVEPFSRMIKSIEVTP